MSSRSSARFRPAPVMRRGRAAGAAAGDRERAVRGHEAVLVARDRRGDRLRAADQLRRGQEPVGVVAERERARGRAGGGDAGRLRAVERERVLLGGAAGAGQARRAVHRPVVAVLDRAVGPGRALRAAVLVAVGRLVAGDAVGGQPAVAVVAALEVRARERVVRRHRPAGVALDDVALAAREDDRRAGALGVVGEALGPAARPLDRDDPVGVVVGQLRAPAGVVLADRRAVALVVLPPGEPAALLGAPEQALVVVRVDDRRDARAGLERDRVALGVEDRLRDPSFRRRGGLQARGDVVAEHRRAAVGGDRVGDRLQRQRVGDVGQRDGAGRRGRLRAPARRAADELARDLDVEAPARVRALGDLDRLARRGLLVAHAVDPDPGRGLGARRAGGLQEGVAARAHADLPRVLAALRARQGDDVAVVGLRARERLGLARRVLVADQAAGLVVAERVAAVAAVDQLRQPPGGVVAELGGRAGRVGDLAQAALAVDLERRPLAARGDDRGRRCRCRRARSA